MQPILTVDLTTARTGIFTIPSSWEAEYLGGASLAARLLYDQITSDLEPLSPQAPLLFLTGPLTGTSGPAVGRFVVCARSPATRLWGESNCGGFWGPELRKAGFDGIWITGRAEKPVYLWVLDGQVEIRDATHLWGQNPYQCQDTLTGSLNHGKVRVASIGKAGESLIPFSVIQCDHGRMAGRTGMGAVMGSKNLKAIAVFGSGKIKVADEVLYHTLRSKANRDLRSDPVTQVASDLGTASVVDYVDYLGSMPKRYYQSGVMEGVDKVSGSTIAETILVGKSACHACVIACGRVVQLEVGKRQKGPEYETIVGFGPNLLIDDLPTIVRLGNLCDQFGLDTISMSNTIGLAFTLFERGIITEADTGGMPLRWGDAGAVEALIHLTIRREGIGKYLAEGARALGRHFNAEELAVQVNGLETAYHDPRGVSGMALVYATSPRGACHNQSDYFFADMGQVETSVGLESFPRQCGAEKASNVARHQDWRTIFNSLVMCFFANVPPEMVVALINAACGLDWTLADFMRSGERAWNLKRAINNRLGLGRANDKLPKQFLQPYAEGGSAGFIPKIDEMLDAYYAARSWDPVTGYPTGPKLEELGLNWIVDDLYKKKV
jgi:aldehyde:ferredoxin oxidoreductase